MPLAKLTRPKLHQVLPRERLFARLDEAARPIVWVVGPPGAGKTALVASWLQQHKVGGVWYQVDAGDRDLSTFFHYLGRAAPPARKRDAPLPTFTPEHGADPAAFARLYFRALFERFKPPAALVFDNYHELPAGAPLHGLLEAIAREAPERVVIVATSRGEPPPECAALRAMDRVALLDWDDLRLTFDETCGIAALRQHLDDTTLRAVHAQSDGWPVGLVLTLEQVKRGHADAGLAQAQGREVLFGYFAGQILDALSPAVQLQLMRIALLPRATAAQAAMIAGDPAAGHLLDSLYRKRLFVERRGDAYQFHDLFRAFLLERLEHTMSPEALAAVRRDAITLLTQAEQVEAAFDIAATTQDWPAAAQIALRFAPMLLEQGRVTTLKSWFDVLPPQVQDASPWMALWHGIALSPFAALQARARFEAAHARFGDAEPMGRILAIGAILATHYLEFDHGQVEEWIDLLLPQLVNAPPFPAAAAELRVNAALLFALSFARPRADLTEACVARLRTLLQRDDIPANARVDAATLMLAYHQINGEFDESRTHRRDGGAVGRRSHAHAELSRALAVATRAFPRQAGQRCRGAQDLRSIAGDRERKRADAAAAAHLRAPRARDRRAVRRRSRTPPKPSACAQKRTGRSRASSIAPWMVRFAPGSRSCATNTKRHARPRAKWSPEWTLRAGLAALRQRLLLAIAEVEADAQADVAPILRDSARSCSQAPAWQHHVHGGRGSRSLGSLRRNGLEAARPFIERCVVGLNAHHGQFMLRMHPTLVVGRLWRRVAAGHRGRRFAARDPRIRLARAARRSAALAVAVRSPHARAIRGAARRPTARVLAQGAEEDAGVAQGDHRARRAQRVGAAPARRAVAGRGGRCRCARARCDGVAPAHLARRSGGDRATRWPRLARCRARMGRRVRVRSRTRGRRRSHASPRRRAEAQPLQRALELYSGAFLVEDEGEPWPVAARERLRGRFIHALARQAERREAAGDDTAAIALYMRGIDADPAIESFYQGLMRCYDRSGRRSEAIAAYQRLRQILSITLGLQPSAQQRAAVPGREGLSPPSCGIRSQ